jgi:hypothetical protein
VRRVAGYKEFGLRRAQSNRSGNAEKEGGRMAFGARVKCFRGLPAPRKAHVLALPNFCEIFYRANYSLGTGWRLKVDARLQKDNGAGCRAGPRH